MESHTCLIGLGSNYNKEEQIAFACHRLSRLFPDIRFSTPRQTPPIGIVPAGLFLNATALFSTALSAEAVTSLLKEIEREAGRRPEEKARGIIRLDLDLLVYDKKACRLSDLQREDIKAGMAELGIRTD